MYTLNDDLVLTVSELLIAADEIYREDPRFKKALRKLGEALQRGRRPKALRLGEALQRGLRLRPKAWGLVLAWRLGQAVSPEY